MSPGRFGMHLGIGTALYVLTANFLAKEVQQLAAGDVDEIVCELANMLCGSVVSRVDGDHGYVLTPPEPMRALPDFDQEDVLISRLDTDSGIITTWFVVEGRAMSTVGRKIRVLIVDDSATRRSYARSSATPSAAEPDLEVDRHRAGPLHRPRQNPCTLHPDVLTLDIEMPRMDGLTFPQAHDAAPSYPHHHHQLARPGVLFRYFRGSPLWGCRCSRRSLRGPIRSAICARPSEPRFAPPPGATARLPQAQSIEALPHPPQAAPGSHPGCVIAIGASTGGTVAIQDILLRLPADMPGMVVTQHIPAGFSLAFANRLNKRLSRWRSARRSKAMRFTPASCSSHPGTTIFFFAPQWDGLHRGFAAGATEVCYQRPSVDVMFASVAQVAGPQAVGLLLTGMGCRWRERHARHAAGGRADHRAGRGKLCRLRDAPRSRSSRCGQRVRIADQHSACHSSTLVQKLSPVARAV